LHIVDTYRVSPVSQDDQENPVWKDPQDLMDLKDRKVNQLLQERESKVPKVNQEDRVYQEPL
jgi:hypothetical protein